MKMTAEELLAKVDKTELNSLANQALLKEELGRLDLDEAEALRLELAILVQDGRDADMLTEDEDDFIHFLTE